MGTFNKDYLRSELKAYKEKIDSFNLPVYIGELGVSYPGLERGGYQWVNDVIAACNELGMGYSYHLYSGYPFGLYNISQSVTPIPKDPARYKGDLGSVFERQVQIYKGQPFPVIIDEQP